MLHIRANLSGSISGTPSPISTTMPSLPSSPITPSFKRRSRPPMLDFDSGLVSPSPETSNDTMFSNSRSQRSSRTSFSSIPKQSPVTLHQSVHRRRSSRISEGSSTLDRHEEDNGFGTLADELEEAWDEYGIENGRDSRGTDAGALSAAEMNGVCRSSSDDATDSMQSTDSPFAPLRAASKLQEEQAFGFKLTSPTTHPHQRARPLQNNLQIERIDASSSPKPGTDDFPPSLHMQISDLVALTQSHTNPLDEKGGIIPRTTLSLRNLGPQLPIESGITSLTTAYTAMTHFRTHNISTLLPLTRSVLLPPPRSQPPDTETIDFLLTSIDALLETTTSEITLLTGDNSLYSIQHLLTSTLDLLSTLQSLSDVAQESRILSSTASRKLKATRDLVHDLTREYQVREEAITYLEEGEWERRLRSREAGGVCREIVGGFEDVCERWRERLEGVERAQGAEGWGGGRIGVAL